MTISRCRFDFRSVAVIVSVLSASSLARAQTFPPDLDLLDQSFSVARPAKSVVDTIFLHFASAVRLDKDKPYDYEKVKAAITSEGSSAHFLVDRTGKIVQLVPLERGAKHGGKGSIPWFPGRNADQMRNRSIGIEIMAIGTQAEMGMGKRAYAKLDPALIGFTEAQYAALQKLLTWLEKDPLRTSPQANECRIEIRMTRRHVIGHEDWARERTENKRFDPGMLFDWSQLQLAPFATEVVTPEQKSWAASQPVQIQLSGQLPRSISLDSDLLPSNRAIQWGGDFADRELGVRVIDAGPARAGVYQLRVTDPLTMAGGENVLVLKLSPDGSRLTHRLLNRRALPTKFGKYSCTKRAKRVVEFLTQLANQQLFHDLALTTQWETFWGARLATENANTLLSIIDVTARSDRLEWDRLYFTAGASAALAEILATTLQTLAARNEIAADAVSEAAAFLEEIRTAPDGTVADLLGAGPHDWLFLSPPSFSKAIGPWRVRFSVLRFSTSPETFQIVLEATKSP